MLVSPMGRLYCGLLCGSFLFIAGCGDPPLEAVASLTVMATPAALSVGGAAVLKAVAHLSDGTTQDVTTGTQWTISNSVIARVSNGALTATAPGTVDVQAAYLETTPAGNSPAAAGASPETLTASTLVTIVAAPSASAPGLSWNAPAAIPYGVPLSGAQLNATARVPGAFVYSPAAGAVLKAGTQTLSVVFTPSNMTAYWPATATVKLSVAQASPSVAWAAPAAIHQGAALSSVQLDARAAVPGIFTYSPAAGVVPAAGTLQLSATFTPGDTTDYSSLTVHNTLMVIAAATPAPPTNPTTPTATIPFGYAGSPVVSTLVPPDAGTAISNDFFGMTIFHTFTPFPKFPVSTERFWEVDPWHTVEPADGQYVWTGMDATINIGKANKVADYVYTLGSGPAWASTDPSAPCTGGEGPGSCALPDMNAFDDFVTSVVRRYCGTIKYYETWNEPNDQQFWSGTNAQLLTVAQHLYQIVRDPANCGCANGVCSPGGGGNPNRVLLPPISRITSSNLSWLDSYLQTAGAEYPFADIASFHGYGATNPEDIVSQVQSLKQILAKHGLSNVPLWNTEADWGPIDPVGPSQAAWLMRYHTALATTGVSRFVWFAYDSCSWGTLWEGYCTNPLMPIEQITAGATAYATVESWLGGANLDSCQVYENGLWACELQRTGGYAAWMLWSSTGTQISVPIAEDFGLTVYRDWQNNVSSLPAELTVDQMPVLVENHDL